MKTITGTYSSAIVYTDIIEETAEEQIKLLCDQPYSHHAGRPRREGLCNRIYR